MLHEDCSVTMHKRYLQFLAIEMFKVAKNSAPTIFYKVFQKIDRHICNLRNITEFNIPLVKTVYNVLESLSYLGRKVRNMLSVEYQEIRIFKNYICNVGYF